MNLLITGEIRDVEKFNTYIDNLIGQNGLKFQKIVYVSGDKRSLGIMKSINKHIFLIHNPKQIKDIGFRNTFKIQNSDLGVGLQEFDSNDIVFKTRPDVIFPTGTLIFLKNYKNRKNEIWTTAISDQYLGLISDHSFLGYRFDLDKLVSKNVQANRMYFSANGTYSHLRLWNNYLIQNISTYESFILWHENFFKLSKFKWIILLANKDFLDHSFKIAIWKARFEVCVKDSDYSKLLSYYNCKIRKHLKVGVPGILESEASFIDRLGPKYIYTKEYENSEKFGRRMLYNNERYENEDYELNMNNNLYLNMLYERLSEHVCDFDKIVAELIKKHFPSKKDVLRKIKFVTQDEVNYPYKVLNVLRNRF